jgi:hypothetical protein
MLINVWFGGASYDGVVCEWLKRGDDGQIKGWVDE